MVRTKGIIGAVLMMLCVALSTEGQEIEFVSSALHHNPYKSIGIVGNFVFCGGENGIHIFDIADPSNPELVKVCDFPNISQMFFDGQYVYLISDPFGPIGLRILDVSVPLEPALISNFGIFFSSEAITRYYENTIFTNYESCDTLGYPTTKLVVIDASDPYNPVISDSLVFPNLLHSMWASDGYLHITTFTIDWAPNDWYILSLSDPAHPDHLHTMNFGQDYIFEVSAYDQYAYLGMFSGINIYDFSNPFNPQLVRIDTASGFGSLLAIDDTVAFTSWYNHGIKTYNLSDPVYPVHMAYANISDEPYGFYVAGDSCFATTIDFYHENASKFNIIDCTNPYFLSVIGEHWTSGRCYDVQLAGDYAYVADGSSGLKVVDISNPEEPAIMDNELAERAKDVLIRGNRLYLLRGYGIFEIYDITTPGEPILLGFNNNYLSIANDIFVDGNYAYICHYLNNNGLVSIFNIGNPTNPTPSYYIGNLYYPRHVIVDSGYAYISDYDSLIIYDVSNLDSITYVSSYQYGNPSFQFAIDQPYLYIASSYTALEILNIQDPANPYFVGAYDSLHTYKITLVDNHALLKGSFNLYLMDISNPEFPRLMSTHTPSNGWSAEEVTVRGDYIYDAAYNLFQILRLTPTGIEEVSTLNLGNFSLPQNYPNPFNASTTISYSLPRPADIRIEVFDILGRRVETLFSGPQQAGEHTVKWRPGNISSGIYYYRIGSEDFGQSRSCLLVK
jgi:hypothetical protein